MYCSRNLPNCELVVQQNYLFMALNHNTLKMKLEWILAPILFYDFDAAVEGGQYIFVQAATPPAVQKHLLHPSSAWKASPTLNSLPL